jgi:hypothetical protein
VVQEVQYNGSQSMSSIFVPTAETSSLRFFLDLMVDLHKPIMFVGGAQPLRSADFAVVRLLACNKPAGLERQG